MRRCGEAPGVRPDFTKTVKRHCFREARKGEFARREAPRKNNLENCAGVISFRRWRK
jgi:hypothetical protein